jgi:hypothetical protein
VLLCKGIYHQQRQQQEQQQQRGQDQKLLLVGLQEPAAAATPAGGRSQLWCGPSLHPLLLSAIVQPAVVQQAAAVDGRSQQCLDRPLLLLLSLVAEGFLLVPAAAAAGHSLLLLMQGRTHPLYKDLPPHRPHTHM